MSEKEVEPVFDEQTLPWQAANEKDFEKFTAWCREHPLLDPNETTQGVTAIHTAASKDRFKNIEYMCTEMGGNSNVVNKAGLTPLIIAARLGHIESAHILVKRCKADVLYEDKEGNTAIHHSAMCNQTEMVQYLLKHLGAELNPRNKIGRTPIHVAAALGKCDMVQFLGSTLKADVSTTDNEGRTLLHAAAYNGHVECVRLLAKEPFSINVDAQAKVGGRTALHEASEKGESFVVDCLLRLGADPVALDNNRRRPWDLAKANGHGHTETGKMLREAMKSKGGCTIS